ncbi:MAG: 4Fe-4S binding protein [Desulfobacterales bacterium]|nr:4Fe-4S binding protein [Desulfobacterales bacterium]
MLSQHDTRARRGAATLMRFFARRVLRPVHALPRRHRQGGGADGARRSGTRALLERAVAGDGATRRSAAWARRRRTRCDCVLQLLPARGARSATRARARRRAPMTTVDFTLDGRDGRGARRARRSSQAARAPRRRDPAPVLQATACAPTATAAPAWWRSRASACWRRPAAAARRRAWRCAPPASARARAQRMVLELLQADVPRAAAASRDDELDAWAAQLGVGAPRFARARSRSRPTCQPPGDRGATSTPASSARAACAPAARSRSTTSSATPGAARTRRSSSTSTTRWAQSTCVACGECVQACPTGALLPAQRRRRWQAPDRSGRLGVPLLRRRLPAHLPRARTTRIVQRRGPRRPGQPRPPVRQGPLRLRLRAPPAAPDACR